MRTRYEPIVTEVRMSDYGYWVVTVSTSPGERVSAMIASIGISKEKAAELGLATLGGLPDQGVS